MFKMFGKKNENEDKNKMLTEYVEELERKIGDNKKAMRRMMDLIAKHPEDEQFNQIFSGIVVRTERLVNDKYKCKAMIEQLNK